MPPVSYDEWKSPMPLGTLRGLEPVEHSAFVVADSSSDKMPLYLSSAEHSRVATISVTYAAAMSSSGGGAAVGCVAAMGPSSGLPT